MAKYERGTARSIASMNDELEKIQNSLADKFDRKPSSGEPNQLETDVDMNGNRIYNLPQEPLTNSDAVSKKYVDKVALSGIPVNIGTDKVFESLTNAKVDTTLTLGDTVRTLGLNIINDGGSNQYVVVNSNGDVILDNGLQLKEILRSDIPQTSVKETYPVLSTITSLNLFYSDVSDEFFNILFRGEGQDGFTLLELGTDYTKDINNNTVTISKSFPSSGTLLFLDSRGGFQSDKSIKTKHFGDLQSALINLNANTTYNKPFVYAHRCYADVNVENTMLSASMAKQQGFDALEVDVQPSADKTLYLFHDVTVDSLTTGTGTFNTLTDAYIDTLRFDALQGTPYADEPIPTLATYLEYIKENNIQSMIELKKADVSDVDLFIDQILTAGCEDLVIISTAFVTDLLIIRNKSKRIRVSTYTVDKTDALLKVEQLSYMLPAELSIDKALTVDTDVLDKAKEYGVLLSVFTISSKREANDVMRNGYNRIISDVYLGDL